MPRSPHPEDERDASDAEGRLARLLDEAPLAAVVPQLAPETLHRLIRHRGIEDSGALVASATPEQLTAVFDLDLWQALRPGLDEQLDARRFGEWIEALAAYDAEQAARVLAAIDANLVAAGLSRHVRVFDIAAVPPASMEDLESVADPAPQGFDREIGGYALRAGRTDVWDAIVRVLTVLASDHPREFDIVMRGCRRLSDSPPEVDGLDELLWTPDQILYDLGAERDDRRRERGYLTPAEARAFLQMARQARHARSTPGPATNPVAAACFRDAEAAASALAAADPGVGIAPPTGSAVATVDGRAAAEAARRVAELLDKAGVGSSRPRALLAGPEERGAQLSRIRRLLVQVRERDTSAYLERSRELAFLANALVSGCSLQSRSLSPQEGRDAALAVCNLGLERNGEALADAFLADHDLVAPFETGWAVLFDEVSRFVSLALLRALENLRPADPETRLGLSRLARELSRQCEAGTPWKARGALEVVALLDAAVWASLLGLLDECPVIPAAMTASLECSAAAVSATTFDFISTTHQIDAVRAFAAELPARLGS